MKVLEHGEGEGEGVKCRSKERKLLEAEELNFLLQSGIILCRLAVILVPGLDIQTDQLQAGNLMTKRRNILLFLEAAEVGGAMFCFLI